MKICLNKKDAEGIPAFHYWHRCPKCGYCWIEETANFCGGCGLPICFKGEDERRNDKPLF